MRKKKPTSDRYELKVGGEAKLSEGDTSDTVERCWVTGSVRHYL